MTGQDKQISRCWGSLSKADIIMSLVSVKEAKETNGSAELLCRSLSVIYVLVCVLVKDFFFCCRLAIFNTQRCYPADKTGRPWLRGESASVSQQIKKEPRSRLLFTGYCCWAASTHQYKCGHEHFLMEEKLELLNFSNELLLCCWSLHRSVAAWRMAWKRYPRWTSRPCCRCHISTQIMAAFSRWAFWSVNSEGGLWIHPVSVCWRK